MALSRFFEGFLKFVEGLKGFSKAFERPLKALERPFKGYGATRNAFEHPLTGLRSQSLVC